MLLPFLLYPVPSLLKLHHLSLTSHPSLISQIVELLSGRAGSVPPPGARPDVTAALACNSLTGTESRVLRYLSTISLRPRSPLNSSCL